MYILIVKICRLIQDILHTPIILVKYKTLICDNNFNHLTLKRKDGRRISFRFHSKYLSIWSKPNAGDFVCIEPWDGLPDFENPNLELSKKEGINSLKPGEEYLFSYEMEFID